MGFLFLSERKEAFWLNAVCFKVLFIMIGVSWNLMKSDLSQ